MIGRLIVPGFVSRRRLPPPLTRLSTRNATAAAAALGDVSSAALPLALARSKNVSRPEAEAAWIAAVITERSVWRAEQT